MERELWPTLYRYVRLTAREVHQKYVQMQPWIIVATMLWAALHDRPVSWACDPRNWSTTRLRPMWIPSEPTMSRRADSVATGLFWRRLEQHLRQSGQPALLAFMDGKPLPVGGNSKDPDARWGRAAGGMAKGYKLHAVWSNDIVPETWEVTPLNVSEKKVAYRLMADLHYGGYLLADGEYDVSYLYDRAFEQGYQLVSPYRQAKKPGGGKHYQSPHRLHSIELLSHECFYGWREGAAHQFFGPNNATDVWSVKKVNPQNMIHLTEKPVKLASRAIEYSSQRGENVLDLFGGSGSTLIAAEQSGRRAYLMELDPLYCDVIRLRYEQFTGQKAELAARRELAAPEGLVTNA
jgi:hypothetical protein